MFTAAADELAGDGAVLAGAAGGGSGVRHRLSTPAG